MADEEVSMVNPMFEEESNMVNFMMLEELANGNLKAGLRKATTKDDSGLTAGMIAAFMAARAAAAQGLIDDVLAGNATVEELVGVVARGVQEEYETSEAVGALYEQSVSMIISEDKESGGGGLLEAVMQAKQQKAESYLQDVISGRKAPTELLQRIASGIRLRATETKETDAVVQAKTLTAIASGRAARNLKHVEATNDSSGVTTGLADASGLTPGLRAAILESIEAAKVSGEKPSVELIDAISAGIEFNHVETTNRMDAALAQAKTMAALANSQAIKRLKAGTTHDKSGVTTSLKGAIAQEKTLASLDTANATARLKKTTTTDKSGMTDGLKAAIVAAIEQAKATGTKPSNDLLLAVAAGIELKKQTTTERMTDALAQAKTVAAIGSGGVLRGMKKTAGLLDDKSGVTDGVLQAYAQEKTLAALGTKDARLKLSPVEFQKRHSGITLGLKAAIAAERTKSSIEKGVELKKTEVNDKSGLTTGLIAGILEAIASSAVDSDKPSEDLLEALTKGVALREAETKESNAAVAQAKTLVALNSGKVKEKLAETKEVSDRSGLTEGTKVAIAQEKTMNSILEGIKLKRTVTADQSGLTRGLLLAITEAIAEASVESDKPSSVILDEIKKGMALKKAQTKDASSLALAQTMQALDGGEVLKHLRTVQTTDKSGVTEALMEGAAQEKTMATIASGQVKKELKGVDGVRRDSGLTVGTRAAYGMEKTLAALATSAGSTTLRKTEIKDQSGLTQGLLSAIAEAVHAASVESGKPSDELLSKLVKGVALRRADTRVADSSVAQAATLAAIGGNAAKGLTKVDSAAVADRSEVDKEAMGLAAAQEKTLDAINSGKTRLKKAKTNDKSGLTTGLVTAIMNAIADISEAAGSLTKPEDLLADVAKGIELRKIETATKGMTPAMAQAYTLAAISNIQTVSNLKPTETVDKSGLTEAVKAAYLEEKGGAAK